MNVAAILKAKGRAVATARPETIIQQIVETLAAHKIGALVVVGEDGRVAGIVSERDIIRVIARRKGDCLSEPVSSIMTRKVVTCTEADTLDALMSIMTENRFRHIPVVENDTLTGIVSIGDVVKNRVAEVEMEATAMRTYLSAG
ncbi:MAG: CBS domain-containing protein [Hyphomicrobiaceae bacterium]